MYSDDDENDAEMRCLLLWYNWCWFLWEMMWMNVNFIKDEDEKLNRFPVVFLALFIARHDANEESRIEKFYEGNLKF